MCWVTPQCPGSILSAGTAGRGKSTLTNVCAEAAGSCLHWLRSQAVLAAVHTGEKKTCPKLNAHDVGLGYLVQMCTQRPAAADSSAEELSTEQGLVTGNSLELPPQWHCSRLLVSQLSSPHEGVRKAKLLPLLQGVTKLPGARNQNKGNRGVQLLSIF